MNRTLKWLMLVVLAAGAISCAGAKSSSISTGSGGSGSNVLPIPLRSCSTDAQCPTGGACVASLCIVKRTSIGDMAIEIDPPSGSEAQITEMPSVGTVMPVLEADSAFPLTINFGIGGAGGGTGTGQNTAVPASAVVILSVPSRINGRPGLSFQANLAERTATLSVPRAIRGAQAMVTLMPLSPSDQTSPPYRIAEVIPLTEDTLALELPRSRLLLSGQVRDALGYTKDTYTARAFQQGLLVSSNGSASANANSPGAFAIALSADTSTGIALELVPNLSTDPWVTFKEPLSLTQPNTDLGPIKLPPYLEWNLYRVPVYGDDLAKPPVADVRVRAYTKFPGDDGDDRVPGDDRDDRISTQFVADGTTDVTGGANLQLIPGDSSKPRAYTISVIPAPGSEWASRCIVNVLVGWTGQPTVASPLPGVSLTRRGVVTGVVTSATGAPVENLIVRATLTQGTSMAPCLPSPTTTSATTNESGDYVLRLDPGTYQLDYIPPPGSAIPRFTAEDVVVDAYASRPVMMPAPALVEGDLKDAMNASLPNATLRIFEPRCSSPGVCKSPLLRAEVQSDDKGHFRAVIAAPPGSY
jgi:hypothetical protein